MTTPLTSSIHFYPMSGPSYLSLHQSGELSARASTAVSRLADCRCCPRLCGVDRIHDRRGACGIGRKAVVCSYGPHLGEEAPLVGSNGSGTIFFGGCNMHCDYCQNHDISQGREGIEVDAERLAGMMIDLQRMGCHNINLVTPSHVIPQILEALDLAVSKGLRLPLVYNSGGYDRVEALRLLDGVVDIYMPDAKYDDPEVAARLSHVNDYPAVMRSALREMHRQVGDLVLEGGVAIRGMIIRHLVLPERLAGSEGVMTFIAEELSRNSYVNIMDQYRPCHKVVDSKDSAHLALKRRIRPEEYRDAKRAAIHHGLKRV